MSWGIEAPDLPGLEEYGVNIARHRAIDDASDIEDEEEFERRIVGLSEREKQRRRRLRSTLIQQREAELEAAKADITDPYNLAKEAIQAVKKPVVKALGEAAYQTARGIERTGIESLAPEVPIPGGTPSAPTRRTNLFGVNPEATRGKTETTADIVLPGTPEELALDTAGGLLLKGGAKAGKAGVKLARGLTKAEDVPVPEVLYHWAPNKNVEGIVSNKLRPGSFLARTPEEAANQARLPGLRTEGSIIEVRPQPGQVKSSRTTLTRRPTFRSVEELAAESVEQRAGPRSLLGRLVTEERGEGPADLREFLRTQRGESVSDMSVGSMRKEYEDVSKQVDSLSKQLDQSPSPELEDQLDAAIRRLDYLEQAGTRRHVDLASGLERTLRESGALTRRQFEARLKQRQQATGVSNHMRTQNRKVREISEATGMPVEQVREVLKTATPAQKGVLTRLANQLKRLASEEEGSLRLPGGGEVPRPTPETFAQRKERLQPGLDAIRNRINDATSRGESFNPEDLGEYARILDEMHGRGKVPSQPVPPTQEQLGGLLPGTQQGLGTAGPVSGPRSGPPTGPTLAQQRLARASEEAGGSATPGAVAPETQAGELFPGPLLEAGTPPPGIAPSRPITAEEGLRARAAAAGEPLGPGIPGEPPTPPSPPGGKPVEPGLPGVPIPPRPSQTVASHVWQSLLSIPGESIAMVTSLSPPILRQGRIRALLSPVKATRELMTSFRTAISEKNFDRVDTAMRSSTWVRRTEGGAFNSGYTYEDLGGHIIPKGSPPEEREIVANSWLGQVLRGETEGNSKASKISRVIFGARKISDRQAIMELNLHRTNWFSEVASERWEFEEALGLPHNIEDYQRLVKDVEHMTQRGSWGQPGNIPLLFSARAWSGRFQALWDIATQSPKGFTTFLPGRKVPGPEREAAKALMAMVGANMAMMQFATAIGVGNMEWKDGLPSVRDGAVHWNPWAGFGGPAKLIFGIAKDLYENVGDAVAKGGWESVPTETLEEAADRAERFITSQLSPVAGKVKAAYTGRDFAGRVYNLEDDIKSGQFFVDLAAPFNPVDIVEAFREGGLGLAAVIGVGSTFSEQVNIYNNLTELRNDAARKLSPTTDPNTGEVVPPPTSYREASPKQKEQIDETAEVAKFREENPSSYQLRRDRLERDSPTIQETADAVKRWRNDQPLDKPLPAKWQEENIARREIAVGLASEFESMFEDFDRTKFDKALDEYYNISPEAIKDPFGNPGFDEAENARQEWLAKQDPKTRQWIDEAVGVSRRKKDKDHQDYLESIDKKKKVGYFEPGITGAEKEELDRQHPDLDVASWLYRGNVLDGKGGVTSPALQSLEAVDQALATGRNRPVKYANVKRAVNQDDKSKAAWQEHGPLLDFYMQGGNIVAKNALAQKQAGVNFDKLPESAQRKVENSIRTSIRSDPTNQAMLYWWGASNIKTIPDKATLNELIRLVQQYGPILEED